MVSEADFLKKVMFICSFRLTIQTDFQIEEFKLNLDEKSAEPEKVRSFDHAGHRSDVRTVSFSSDNTAIVSGSHESIKIWNRASVVSSCFILISWDYQH